MLAFASDYMDGAHEDILNALIKTNYEHLSGYGSDYYCDSAADKIRKACDYEEAEVKFISGGTQTNQIVIDSMLRPYQGVVCADTGHIASHEAGAIECSGHKVMVLPGHEGKLAADKLEKFLKTYWSDENHEHMVMPGMVYISQPTELGTMYTAAELYDLRKVCTKFKVPLYMDGARLAYALAADKSLTLKEYADVTDVFYIGGTKCGAMFGEALIFTNTKMPRHFTSIVKQHGALLAKGWTMGVQFDTLFTNDLYYELGETAVKYASKIREALVRKGYDLFIESPTNQQFVIMDNDILTKLSGNVKYSFWQEYDEKRTVVRFVTSWATTEEDVDALIDLL